ncbi:restriction endonuclease subunit S [Streptococcus suis]|uniref:Restriction endonuclease S subunit n=1 Tax=Streptococcus suis TaxID=1307 RepID=A0A0Z8LU76_STRSU|nr:restriction endonuclease subunit S [Streptococcus suis]NQF81820.1 restriction endonuclease subunit S [Streptococcus suis]NQK58484.1 restriction endonuclease subunit S [Streptococcus suis]CYV96972.1 Restriction endonuclease S subunit [Streptococcus suis]
MGEVSKRVTRRNKELISSLPLTISAQHGLVDQEEFFNKQVASKDVSSYYLIKKGEFAYNKSYSNGYPWGAIKRLDRYEMGVLSTLYIVFKPTSLICSDYLVSYYDTVNWYKEVSMIAAEGARNHGLLNIAPNDFFKTRLFIPTLPEQEAIGNFFSDLDQLITLHQRK